MFLIKNSSTVAIWLKLPSGSSSFLAQAMAAPEPCPLFGVRGDCSICLSEVENQRAPAPAAEVNASYFRVDEGRLLPEDVDCHYRVAEGIIWPTGMPHPNDVQGEPRFSGSHGMRCCRCLQPDIDKDLYDDPTYRGDQDSVVCIMCWKWLHIKDSGWQCYTDPTLGNLWWHHAATDTSQWENPNWEIPE